MISGFASTSFSSGVFFEGDVDDGEAFRNADLRRREAYAFGFVHGLKHVLDKLFQLVVELGHWGCGFFQDRISVLHDGIDHWSVGRSSLGRGP